MKHSTDEVMAKLFEYAEATGYAVATVTSMAGVSDAMLPFLLSEMARSVVPEMRA